MYVVRTFAVCCIIDTLPEAVEQEAPSASQLRWILVGYTWTSVALDGRPGRWCDSYGLMTRLAWALRHLVGPYGTIHAALTCLHGTENP